MNEKGSADPFVDRTGTELFTDSGERLALFTEDPSIIGSYTLEIKAVIHSLLDGTFVEEISIGTFDLFVNIFDRKITLPTTIEIEIGTVQQITVHKIGPELPIANAESISVS